MSSLAWEALVPNMVSKFFQKTPIFHFPSAQNGISCEASTRNMVQPWSQPIFTQTSPYFMVSPHL